MPRKKVAFFAKKLARDFADFHFKKAARARWSPREKTIFFDEILENLFHELGHAVNGDENFANDIDLIHRERAAWTTGAKIAQKYGVEISPDTIESALDSYRDWIFLRAICPNCNQCGVQNVENLEYCCINCGTRWRVNDAREKNLRKKKCRN